MITRLTLFALILVTLISCQSNLGGISSKKGSSNEYSGELKIFMKGDTTMYFVHNLIFKEINSRDKLSMDCTYYYNEKGQSSTLNYFTFTTKDRNFKPKNINFTLPESNTYNINEFEKLFAKISGKNEFSYRYSFSLPDTIFDKWVSTNKPTFIVNRNLEFISKRKNRKKLKAIYNTVIFNKSRD